ARADDLAGRAGEIRSASLQGPPDPVARPKRFKKSLAGGRFDINVSAVDNLKQRRSSEDLGPLRDGRPPDDALDRRSKLLLGHSGVARHLSTVFSLELGDCCEHRPLVVVEPGEANLDLVQTLSRIGDVG